MRAASARRVRWTPRGGFEVAFVEEVGGDEGYGEGEEEGLDRVGVVDEVVVHVPQVDELVEATILDVPAIVTPALDLGGGHDGSVDTSNPAIRGRVKTGHLPGSVRDRVKVYLAAAS